MKIEFTHTTPPNNQLKEIDSPLTDRALYADIDGDVWMLGGPHDRRAEAGCRPVFSKRGVVFLMKPSEGYGPFVKLASPLTMSND